MGARVHPGIESLSARHSGEGSQNRGKLRFQVTGRAARGSVKFLNRRSTLETGELNPPAIIKLEPAGAASTSPMEFARIGGRRGKSPWQRIACPIRCDNPAGPPTSTKR